MSEPSAFSNVSLSLMENLVSAKAREGEDQGSSASLNPSSLQHYSIEMNKAISIMRNNHPDEISTPFKGNCLEITKCGKMFVFGSIEGRIGIVDIESKEILQDIDLESGPIYSIALFNHENHLLAAGKDGKIRRFNLKDFTEVRTFEGHEKEVNSVIVSVDDSFIFSASDDSSVRGWSLGTEELTGVLYYHEKAVLALDQSLDGTYLVSGGADKKIKLFHLQNAVVEKSISDFNSSVWAVKISFDNKILAGGDNLGEIKVWNVDTFDLLKVFKGHEKRVSHLEFTKDEKILISSSNDFSLRLWDLVEEKKEVIMTGHTDWVKGFKLSSDEKTIYSIAENYKIMSWKLPRFENSCRRTAHEKDLKALIFARKNNWIFTSDFSEIKVWNIKEKNCFQSLDVDLQINALCIDSDNETLLIAYSNYEIFAWNLEQETFKKRVKHAAMVSCMSASNDNAILAVGDINFRVTLYNKMNFKVMSTFRRHNNIVTVLAYCRPVLSETKQLFSGGEDNAIYTYFFNDSKCIKLQGGHLAVVSALEVSRKNDILISGDVEGNCKIWNLAQLICVRVLPAHKERIARIYFTENSKYFWIASGDCNISLWNVISYAAVTRLITKNPVSFFVCSKDEVELISCERNEVVFLENPLKTYLFYVYGPGHDSYAFFRYILNICDDNDQPHDPEMDKWIITPYEINALHFYAYFNLPLHLKAAINSGAPFYDSRFDYSPLTIALNRNFRDCINVITKAIRLKIEEDPYLVSYLESHIIALNKIGFKGLDGFYSSVLFKSKDKFLPKFCDDSVDLPIVFLSRNMAPQQKDFFSPEQVSGFGQPLTFWQSALRIDTLIGSSNSIIFLESILECPNTDIFKTELIKQLILYKWKYVKWVLLPQAMTYFFYMICLSIYMIVFQGSEPTLFLTIFLTNLILAFYELFQLLLTGWNYFSDPWNYIDFARTSLNFVYVFYIWAGLDKFVSQQLLVGMAFMTMTRGISYFRLFDSTRYMINLLSEVISDIRSFLILLTYSTYSFALIYFIMVNNIKKMQDEKDYQPTPFSTFVADAYMLNLGNFSTDNYGAFEWVVFFFASVINPLIMLNLLISIMGDTFGRVQEGQEIADMIELTEMVLEGEYILFCRRHLGQKSYLQICREEELTSVELSIDVKLDKLKEKISMLEESVESKSQEIITEVKDTIAGVNIKVDEMTDLIEQISLTQD
jgi:WD40 repeat protein